MRGSKNRRIFLDAPLLTGLEKSAIQSLTGRCPFKNVLTQVNSVSLCSQMSEAYVLWLMNPQTRSPPQGCSLLRLPLTRASEVLCPHLCWNWPEASSLLWIPGSVRTSSGHRCHSHLVMSVYQGAEPEEGLFYMLPQLVLQVEDLGVIILG